MKIIQAESLGICFGVRDALAQVAVVDQPTQVEVRGELVHNPEVTRALRERGFLVAHNVQLSVRGTVLITAHGVSNKERERFLAAGKKVLDTTCPLVRRAHNAALKLAQAGYFVIVIGKPGHVEVTGLTGDLPRFAIVEHAADVRRWHSPRLGIICQTTSAPEDVREITHAIALANPSAEIRAVDTVCQPTKERQRALETLLGNVDLVVVVGGKASNNTRKLVERCHARGVPALHVEGTGELQREMFRGVERVGLTAGTSTLPATIHAVRAELEAISIAQQPTPQHENSAGDTRCRN